MKINIALKLFFGFLIVIGLNASFVLIVSKLTSLNNIASIVKKQNEVKNDLLNVSTLHANQSRSRLIYETIGKKESAENFKKTGSQVTKIIDSVISNINTILKLDSIVSSENTYNPDIVGLMKTVKMDIKINNRIYNKAFSELLSIKDSDSTSKRESIIATIDTADTKLKSGLITTDSLIECQTMTRIKEIETRIDNVRNLTQIILLCMTVFSIGFALIFSRIITNSLRRLKEAAKIIATGDFNFDPHGYPKDEIGDLANAFFNMANDLKRTQDELIKKRRLAAIGEIVASVNHEINNPLMIISGNAQFLEMTIDEGVTEDTKERIHSIIKETERISQVTRKLRDIKKPIVEDYTTSGERMINIDKSSD